MKWTIIRNPNASGGKGLKYWPKLRDALLAGGIDFEDFRTEAPGHAIQLTREAIGKGSRYIIAYGGDGTVNEVANGILGQSYCDPQKILFTQIPVGTGNDWSRTMQIPKKIAAIPNFLKTGTERIQDVGLLTWRNLNGNQEQRYFVNMAGMGFDAYVGKVANAKKAAGKSGALGYISALLSSLFAYKAQAISLSVDNQEKGDFLLFSCSVGICRYSGAGMLQCPDASYNDGLLDLTLIEKIGKWKVIRNIPRLFNGSFVKNKEVHQFRGQYITIKATDETLLEVDGEVIGQGSASCSILPGALRVLGGAVLPK